MAFKLSSEIGRHPQQGRLEKLKGPFPLAFLLALLLLAGWFIWGQWTQEKRDGRPPEDVALAFSEIPLPHFHLHRKTALPFMAGAVLDIDNDGTEELFIGGGVRQSDSLFRFDQDRFRDISETAGLMKLGGGATYGAAVLDADGNGYSDLLLTRDSGVWLYLNRGGVLTGKNLQITMPENAVPLSLAVADINRDGHFDMYISGGPRKPPGWRRFFWFLSSAPAPGGALFLNDGEDSFFEITEAAGLEGAGKGGQAVFVDIDNDGLDDLVTTHFEGGVSVWKNSGDQHFRLMPAPNSEEYGFPMGLATGDIDNDGLVDLFLTNIGSTVPKLFAGGDAEEGREYNPHWMLLRNEGEGRFENIAERAGLAGRACARGAVFEDMNLDGREDLIVSSNHPDWPLHRLPLFRQSALALLQTANGEFLAAGAEAGMEDNGYGVSPLIADFNGDGYPDLVLLNMGGVSRAYLGKKGKNHYLKVKLPDTVESVGAVVTVRTLRGKTLSQPFIVGKGLCSDSSHTLIFGLGEGRAIDVGVTYRNHATKSLSGELFDTTIRF